MKCDDLKQCPPKRWMLCKTDSAFAKKSTDVVVVWLMQYFHGHSLMIIFSVYRFISDPPITTARQAFANSLTWIASLLLAPIHSSQMKVRSWCLAPSLGQPSVAVKYLRGITNLSRTMFANDSKIIMTMRSYYLENCATAATRVLCIMTLSLYPLFCLYTV